jgi:hypothetical protein
MDRYNNRRGHDQWVHDHQSPFLRESAAERLACIDHPLLHIELPIGIHGQVERDEDTFLGASHLGAKAQNGRTAFSTTHSDREYRARKRRYSASKKCH